MMKRHRFLCLMLCAGLLCSMIVPATAEISTLGVYFAGVRENADGSVEKISLEGSFYVFQNGMSRGVLRAGKDQVTVEAGVSVTVKPVLSTMPDGWVIPEAGVVYQPDGPGHSMVPFVVESREKSTVQPEATVDTPQPETQLTYEPEKAVPDYMEPAPVEQTTAATVEVTAQPASPQAVGISVTPLPKDLSAVMTPTPVPTATEIPVTPAPVSEGGTLLVHVFSDANYNGEEGKYEVPVPGVVIEALNEEGTTVAYGTTGETGDVVMNGLEAGTYRIRVSCPVNWGFSKKGKTEETSSNCMDTTVERTAESQPVRVTEGNITARGVGISKMTSVSGYCWKETDPDGICKSGEAKLAGVRIQMKGQKNGLVYETTSDAEGNWNISQIKPGLYDMTVFVPDGMVFTKYSTVGGSARSFFTAEGKSKATKMIDMNDGKSRDQLNFGFTEAAQIYGACFLDANYNGVLDEGEAPLAGVKMRAYKSNGDLVGETVSDENGYYALESLRAGTYSVRCVLPEKQKLTFSCVNSNPGGNAFRSRNGFRETTIEGQNVGTGEDKLINVGAIVYSSISGTAYIDKDLSGSLTGKEQVVSGLFVKLLDRNGNELAVDRTTVKGRYIFENLVPGVYRLQLAAKEGYAFTRHGEGNVIVNTSNGNGRSEQIEIPIGTDLTGMDIGMIIPGTVSGVVFADANDNGLRDAGEQGMEGMKVHVTEDGQIVYTTTVNRDGSFKFDAVMPGTYSLRYELPQYGIFAKVQEKGNTLTGEGFAETEAFNVGSAGSYTAPLCGVLTLGEVNGHVFRDSNGNGTQDEGEENVAGTTVSLVPSREDLEPVTLTTGEDGGFRFGDIHPDTYALTFTFPEGSVMSRTDDINLPVQAGTTGETRTLEIPMGTRITEQQLGCVIPAALQGRLWLDENNNGRFDEGEATPAGQSITVMDEKNGQTYAVLTTDEEGCFRTSGMIPGSFTVSYTMDSNSAPTPEGDSTFVRNGDTLVMTGILLTENEKKEDLLLGIVRYTSLGGSVWKDEQGEIVPLMNATLTLSDAAGNKIQDKVTAENGQYLFTGLMPGEYRLSVLLPAGSLVVYPEDERLESDLISIMTQCSGREGQSDTIELKMGVDQTNLNVGSVVPGTIGDFCWLDENGNGWQDGGESGIPGVKIELMEDGEVILETVSDEYGFYRFPEVYPAGYSMRVTPPAEVKPTTRKDDIPVLVSVLTETNEEVCYAEAIQVTSAKQDLNVDLGFVLRREGDLPSGYKNGSQQIWN